MTIPHTSTVLDGASDSVKHNVQGALQFRFEGNTSDYYRIFVTNTLLTVITLGIYSAWAKVRNKRFFYGNTYLGQHNFDFDADPIAILISRLILLVLLLVFVFGDSIIGSLYSGIGVLSLVVLCLLPFAVVRGRSFNARHTTHRSVRFCYDKIYMPSVSLFLAYFVPIIIVSILTYKESTEALLLLVINAYILLITPAYFYFKHRIHINQLNFGKLSFSYKAKLRDYYKIVLVALLFFFALGTVANIVNLIIFGAIVNEDSSLSFVIILIFGLLAYLVFFGTFRSRIVELFYSSIEFDEGSKVISKIRSKEYFLKYFLVNTIALVFSLGMLLPWVRIRTWRYVSEQISFLPSRKTGVVLTCPDREISPIAGEFADISDFDLDFGVI